MSNIKTSNRIPYQCPIITLPCQQVLEIFPVELFLATWKSNKGSRAFVYVKRLSVWSNSLTFFSALLSIIFNSYVDIQKNSGFDSSIPHSLLFLLSSSYFCIRLSASFTETKGSSFNFPYLSLSIETKTFLSLARAFAINAGSNDAASGNDFLRMLLTVLESTWSSQHIISKRVVILI